MPKTQKSVIICENCNSELHFSKAIIEKMKYCPFCSFRLNPPIDEIKKNLKLAIYPYIDSYGVDFVLNTIKSIEIKDGLSARDAIFNEYYRVK